MLRHPDRFTSVDTAGLVGDTTVTGSTSRTATPPAEPAPPETEAATVTTTPQQLRETMTAASCSSWRGRGTSTCVGGREGGLTVRGWPRTSAPAVAGPPIPVRFGRPRRTGNGSLWPTCSTGSDRTGMTGGPRPVGPWSGLSGGHGVGAVAGRTRLETRAGERSTVWMDGHVRHQGRLRPTGRDPHLRRQVVEVRCDAVDDVDDTAGQCGTSRTWMWERTGSCYSILTEAPWAGRCRSPPAPAAGGVNLRQRRRRPGLQMKRPELARISIDDIWSDRYPDDTDELSAACGEQYEWASPSPGRSRPCTSRALRSYAEDTGPGRRGVHRDRLLDAAHPPPLLPARMDAPLQGLCWWREAGKPTDDACLALIADVWDADGDLDWYTTWIAGQEPDRATKLDGIIDPSYLSARSNPDDDAYEVSLRELATSLGGSDPLHLGGHCDGPLEETNVRPAGGDRMRRAGGRSWKSSR